MRWTRDQPTAPTQRETTMNRVLCKKHVTYLRQRMREFLAVPDDWNPIPIVASEQRSTDTQSMLSLPPVLSEGVA